MFGETAEAAFRIALYFHFGTAISVVLKYWRTYLDALLKKENRDVLRLLIVASLATGVIGIPLYLLLKNTISMFSGMLITGIIGALLLVTATLMRLGKLKSTDRKTMAERIRLRMKDESMNRFKGEPCVTASLGVASMHDNPENPGNLQHKADEALYTAKESGRNRVARW